MKGKCCDEPMKTIFDGCLKVVKRCSRCEYVYTQWKRRPAGLDYKQCSWRMFCPDHPQTYK